MVCWSSRKNIRWPFKMFSSSVSKAIISVTKDFRLIRTGIAMISWQIVGQSSFCRRPPSLRPSAVWWMSQRRPSPPQACALPLLPPHPHAPRKADWQRETPEPATSLNRLTQTAVREPGRSTVQQRPLRPAQGGLALPASPSSFSLLLPWACVYCSSFFLSLLSREQW